MTGAFGRRRALTITAAAAGAWLLPWPGSGPGAGAAQTLRRWRGVALGARAEILLYHRDRDAADRLIAACLSEIARLERVFSLYRADSALCALNRDGALAFPPMDLVRLLADARRFSGLTDGAFDVTVQPLWRLYADHFSRPGADPGGPGAAAVARARALVDYAALSVASDRIAFARPGMAVTLNGIAQGYITDRVADLLRRGGIERVLVSLGETRGLGRHPDGRAWRVGLADPRDPGRSAETIEIEDRAVATSGGYGTRFDAAGRHHHLFDPRTGRSSNRYLSVSVIAPTATTADALSTALTAMPVSQAQGVLDAAGRATALFTTGSGARITRTAAA